MATNKKPAAKPAAKTVKPAAPTVTVKSDAEGASLYRVTGRISLGDGVVLRPANEAKGREADTVELTDREAYDLAGYVEPVDQAAAEPPTE